MTSPEGFEVIYVRYWEKVFAVCYNSTERIELAQSMTQDIFKSIWERRDSIQIEKSIEHYLVRSAKKKVAEYFRNQSIRSKHLDLASHDDCAAANCTEQDVAYSLLVEELNLLVGRLPCQCRNVYRMSREQGLTNKQIAQELKISERAVEYHISKAISFLKKNLPEYDIT